MNSLSYHDMYETVTITSHRFYRQTQGRSQKITELGQDEGDVQVQVGSIVLVLNFLIFYANLNEYIP